MTRAPFMAAMSAAAPHTSVPTPIRPAAAKAARSAAVSTRCRASTADVRSTLA